MIIIIEILDWSGTICIVLGSLMLSRSKITDKSRLIVFLFYIISNSLWIPMSIILTTYGLLTTQIILFIINLKGIITCILKINKKECYHKWEYYNVWCECCGFTGEMTHGDLVFHCERCGILGDKNSDWTKEEVRNNTFLMCQDLKSYITETGLRKKKQMLKEQMIL